MPSHYAHWYFGHLVRKALPVPLRTLLRSDPAAYLAGLQGPDVLFHYHPLLPNAVRKEGTAIHRRSGMYFFVAAREALLQQDSPSARCYLAGAMCHYMLDSACHPLVARAEKDTGLSHSAVETELDRSLMAAAGMDPYGRPAMDLLPASRALGRTMAPFYRPATPAQIETALHGMRRDIRLTRVRSDSLREAIFWVLRRTGTYAGYHGIFFSPTAAPGCEGATEELTARLRETVAPTVEEIQAFFAAVDGEVPLSQRLKPNFGGTNEG